MKVVIENLKPRDYVAKDLRSPKYRIRVAQSKKKYKRVSTFKLIKEYYE